MAFSPIVIGSGVAGFSFLKRTQEEQMDRLARAPQTARDIGAFKDRIAGIETVDDLMGDRALLRVALGAFGLDDDVSNTAFIRRVLESDLNDRGSLVNKLSDKRYFALASTFNFAGSAPRLPGANAADGVRDELAAAGSVEALLVNEGLLTRALQAFDLEDDRTRPQFLARVLTSDPNDPTSLVNRLNDPRYVGLVRAFQGKPATLSADFIARVGDEAAAKLGAISSADDLLADRTLLRSALRVFGLEDQAANTYFLKQVLESDPGDETSFVNGLRDPRYAELATAFGFEERAAAQSSVYGFAEALKSRTDTLRTADDLIADEALLEITLDVFGLEVDDMDFLKEVLDSDLTDETSVANRNDDPRYRALADVFGFAEMRAGATQEDAQTKITRLIRATDGRATPASGVAELFQDPTLMLATMNLFDVRMGEGGVRYARAALDSLSPESRFSGTLTPDPRYRAFYDAMNFRPEPEGRAYPSGFAEAVTRNYLERQFELQVGEVEPNLRVALSLDRELSDIADRFSSENGRWFGVLSSQPLRLFFETTFGLPESFGTIDIDQQVTVLRERSERAYGTSSVKDLLAPETLDDMRNAFLTAAQVRPRAQINASGPNPALSLLGGA